MVIVDFPDKYVVFNGVKVISVTRHLATVFIYDLDDSFVIPIHAINEVDLCVGEYEYFHILRSWCEGNSVKTHVASNCN